MYRFYPVVNIFFLDAWTPSLGTIVVILTSANG